MDVTKRCEDINELVLYLKPYATRLIEECKKQGIDIKITETYRSQARQDYLYAQGRTRPGNIVTNAKTSVHTSRKAFDVCINVKGNEYDEALLKRVGKIGESIGLEWGGNWSSFKDSPHFQMMDELKKNTLKIKLNGVVKEVEYIEKNGNNFVKLQYLRDSKITIEYDGMPIVEVK